jgi:hypothetical protein
MGGRESQRKKGANKRGHARASLAGGERVRHRLCARATMRAQHDAQRAHGLQQRNTASQQQQAAAVANESGVLAKRKIKEIVDQVP